MIISASRRTDIPAFYSKWFVNRIRSGFVDVKNPFNYKQIRRVSLYPNDVTCIVFWTRNPSPLINYFKLLDDYGYKYYFQYTISPYEQDIDRNNPSLNKSLSTFKRVSDLLGSARMVIRYDPIMLSSKYSIQYHRIMFNNIISEIHGYTSRVVISFLDEYKKVIRKLKDIDYIKSAKSNPYTRKELLQYMKEITADHNMFISSCSESKQTSCGIPHGACIDWEIISSLGIDVNNLKADTNQRENCLCLKSVDIGSYNTCLHDCLYCYATNSHTNSLENYKKHQVDSPLLL